MVSNQLLIKMLGMNSGGSKLIKLGSWNLIFRKNGWKGFRYDLKLIELGRWNLIQTVFKPPKPILSIFTNIRFQGPNLDRFVVSEPFSCLRFMIRFQKLEFTYFKLSTPCPWIFAKIGFYRSLIFDKLQYLYFSLILGQPS